MATASDELKKIQDLIYNGAIGAALEKLSKLESGGDHNPVLLSQLAELYVLCNRHARALDCNEKAMALQPGNPAYVYNVAASCIAMGHMQRAEELFNRVIYLKPDDYDAWQNRSALRTQSKDSNHIEQLKYVKQQLSSADRGEVPVCFALAKELEDLGRFNEAFAYLQEGAHKRRQVMRYEVAGDEAVMERIRTVFNQDLMHAKHESVQTRRPVFVLGLPRSGTTLVDRIISSHSQADSIGESNALALAVMRASNTGEKPAKDKLELVVQSARMDFAELGRYYTRSLEGLGSQAMRLVDKTPLNFLYLGLIHLAMPGARIIHLRRHPVDSCYAMYKTLFRMGYPFTYSLEDVGRYYIAYQRLMAHWRELIPQAFLDVDYEQLVYHQESETHRILDYLELDWENACLDFHKHQGAAATASAAQVRQPIYSSSVGRWQCYAQQLAPFIARLKEHGVELD